ncbi:MAG TPA: hypothetical protein VGN26_19600 [Armatimonadota bacterium]
MDQTRNLREIEGLNQRGGRILTVVDLIEAGTLSPELAAYLLCAISGGASFLTASLPGNAGKTTVLANLLTFLPGDSVVRTVASPADLEETPNPPSAGRVCWLLHEIGDASIYSYLWGRDAVRFLGLPGAGQTVASCLHADTLPQMRDALLGRLGLPEGAFSRLGLLVFIHYRETPLGAVRRVSAVYESRGEEEHRLVFEWDPGLDQHLRRGESLLPGCRPERLAWGAQVIEGALGRNLRQIDQVRDLVVRSLGPAEVLSS